MDDNAMYKIPTIDFSVPSLLALAQLGIFAVFAYWGLEGGVTENSDYIFPLAMGASGLALFLSVPYARIAVTAGMPAVMLVLAVVVEGEPEMAFWALFMFAMLGCISYLPAMAVGDQTLELDDETRMQRMGPLWVIFALFILMMFGTIEGAIAGELTDEDSDGNETKTDLDSNQQMIAQAGLAMGVIGIVVFLVTGVMGTEVSMSGTQIRPWHGGALASGAVCLTGYLWYATADFLIVDVGLLLAVSGILTLSACAAYEGGDSPSGSVAGTESE